MWLHKENVWFDDCSNTVFELSRRACSNQNCCGTNSDLRNPHFSNIWADVPTFSWNQIPHPLCWIESPALIRLTAISHRGEVWVNSNEKITKKKNIHKQYFNVQMDVEEAAWGGNLTQVDTCLCQKPGDTWYAARRWDPVRLRYWELIAKHW